MLSELGRTRGTVLVVDDEECTGRLVRRHFPGWTVIQAFTLAAAGDQLDAAPDLRLVLLDLNLSDTIYSEPLLDNPFQGSFDLARRIRQAHPSLPIVIFSAHINGDIANAAHQASAELVSKHDAAANLDLLCCRLESAAVQPASPAAYIAWLRDHRGLSPRESEVAALALQGITSYAVLGDHLGISPNTVKRHVTRLLDCAGVDSLFDFIFRGHGLLR